MRANGLQLNMYKVFKNQNHEVVKLLGNAGLGFVRELQIQNRLTGVGKAGFYNAYILFCVFLILGLFIRLLGLSLLCHSFFCLIASYRRYPLIISSPLML